MYHNVVWAEAYLNTKWHLDPCSRLAATDMGRKLGGSAPVGGLRPLFGEGLGPHLTHSPLG